MSWNKVKRKHVLEAIKLFEGESRPYPKAISTYLFFNEKKYPAKHIRGIAYEIANGKTISKQEYSGGGETKRFFNKLGFETDKSNQLKSLTIKNSNKKKIRLSETGQKNALQKLLQRIDVIETEKGYEWLRTPSKESISKDYKKIINGLVKVSKNQEFLKNSKKLNFDIVIEKLKLIIEYDERQHFTVARAVSLKNYPETIKLQFDKRYWIHKSELIKAVDNDKNSRDRDVIRALYDSVRDIEAGKHGYKLIRIKHGDFDWESEKAFDRLKSLIQEEDNYPDIIRFVLPESFNLSNYFAKLFQFSKFVDICYKKRIKTNFLLFPGGFLNFKWPVSLHESSYLLSDLEKTNIINIFLAEAEKEILKFINGIFNNNKIKQIADFMIIGIDLPAEHRSFGMELVSVYDTVKKKVILWTGKSYPTGGQINELIKINDLRTHFIQLCDKKVMVLGCHDLNMFSNRAKKNSKPGGERDRVQKNMRNITLKEKPDIVLQLPHYTFSPIIWRAGWYGIKQLLKGVNSYASGIYHKDSSGDDRISDLNATLKATKYGKVLDYVVGKGFIKF